MSAYPKAPVSILQNPPNIVVGQTRRIVRIVAVANKPVGNRVETIQATFKCAHPQRAHVILKDADHYVVAQTGRIVGTILITHELFGGDVHNVQARARAHPQMAAAVCNNGVDAVVAQRCSVVRIVPVAGKNTGLGIKSVQATASRAGPHCVVLTNPHSAHSIAGNRRGIVGVVTEGFKTVFAPNPAHQTTALGRQPQILMAVLGDAPDKIALQRVGVRAVLRVVLKIVAVESV